MFLNRAGRLKTKTLRHLFKQIASDILADKFPPVIRARLSLSTPPAPPEYGTVSFLLGYVDKQPIFANGQLSERLLAYVLILERGERAALQLRHISTLEIGRIFEYFDLSTYAEITSIFSDKANIVRLTSKIMNPARSGLTGRAYEGSSLQTEMPQYGSGKSIPRSLKGIDEGETLSITAGVSRITSYGQSLQLDTIGPWFKEMCERLKNNTQSTFLSRFAEPIEFSAAISVLKSNLVVFDILALKQKLEQEGFELVKNLKSKGSKKVRRVRITPSMEMEVFEKLAADCRVKNDEFSWGKISKAKNKLKLDLPEFAKIGVFDGKKYHTLPTYINSKDLFSIYFDQLDHVHLGGSIFRDRGLSSDIDAVLAALKIMPALAITDREKVDKNYKTLEPLRGSFQDFPPTSIFDVVENHFNKASYVFCDDMGNEWADHILLQTKPPAITFVHSKHGKLNQGASSLHIVVSQALKNLGNLLCKPENLSQKVRGFKGTRVKGTKIAHLRRKPKRQNFDDMVSTIEKIAAANSLSRHAALACDFLSYNQTTINFGKLRAGQPVSPYVHQQLWLLSYYVAACREISVIPEILCQP